MTKRTDEKALYLAALRGDAKAQRTCTEKGKLCGGRCIPKSWNCRIKGEGDTPPTRGNAVQLSAEQKEKIQKARSRRRTRRALTAIGGAAAVGAAVAGAAAYGAKNPAKARRLANKLGGGGASEALGVASALGGPAAAGVAGVANLGVAGFQVGARMGAGLAQRNRAIRTYRSLLRKKVVLSRQVKRLEGRTGYFEGFVRRAEANLSAKKAVREASTQSLKRIGQIQRGYNASNSPRSIGQTDKTRKQNQVRAGKDLRAANQRLNDHTKKLNAHLAEVAKAKKSLNATNWKLGKIKTGLESASNPIRNTITGSLSGARSNFRAGRRQVSGFVRYQGRRGPKADPRSWQERFGLDEAEREDKKCGNSGIPDNAKCTKGVGQGGESVQAKGGYAKFLKAKGVDPTKLGANSKQAEKLAQEYYKTKAGKAELAQQSSDYKKQEQERRKGGRRKLAAAIALGAGAGLALQALKAKKKPGYKDPKRSEYVKEQLKKMRAKGTGKYGSAGRRRTGVSFRPDEAQRDDVVFTNKELHARVKAEAKRKFKVYPSAYANAWMVKQYKKRGGTFRNDDLKKWFNEKWVRMSAKGEILGECGDRGKGEGKPRCLPLAKARALSKKERAKTVRAKRKADPKKNRSGAAKMVPNTFDSEGKKYSKTVVNPETGRKRTVKYGAKGYRIAPGTDKGDRYCARSFGDMKSHNKNCAGKDRNTPLCLSRAKWKCSGKKSR